MTCSTCTHYDTPRKDSPGMAPCVLEPHPFRLARRFSPTAPCNKGKHTPITPSNQLKKEREE